jgi:hypothetical protein
VGVGAGLGSKPDGMGLAVGQAEGWTLPPVLVLVLGVGDWVDPLAAEGVGAMVESGLAVGPWVPPLGGGAGEGAPIAGGAVVGG